MRGWAQDRCYGSLRAAWVETILYSFLQTADEVCGKVGRENSRTTNLRFPSHVLVTSRPHLCRRCGRHQTARIIRFAFVASSVSVLSGGGGADTSPPSNREQDWLEVTVSRQVCVKGTLSAQSSLTGSETGRTRGFRRLECPSHCPPRATPASTHARASSFQRTRKAPESTSMRDGNLQVSLFR